MLDAEFFLGGDMPLDLASSQAALGRIADKLKLPVGDTAAGVHELVNQNMAASSRMHAVELGADLRGVTLLAFGGAGPVHACGVAELLESPRVIFPVNASVLSALGTLVSPVRIDLARSMVRPIQGIDEAERDAAQLPMWEGDRYFLPLVFDNDPRTFHGVMPYKNGRPESWSFERW
jgi:N-methylhydantoinase A